MFVFFVFVDFKVVYVNNCNIFEKFNYQKYSMNDSIIYVYILKFYVYYF